MSAELQPGFLASFDAMGVHRWSRVLAQGTTPIYAARALGITSSADQVVVAGTFGRPGARPANATLDLGGAVGAIAGLGNTDAFIAMFDESSGVATAARVIGGTSTEQGTHVLADRFGVIESGSFSTDVGVDFGDGPRGGGGAFVAAYTPDFDFRWVWLNPAAYGVSTVPLAADRIVVAGSFGGTIDLGGGTPFTATRPVDVFVVMLGPS